MPHASLLSCLAVVLLQPICCCTHPASFDISGNSEGCKQQADLLLLQVQLGLPHVVAKVHGLFFGWQMVQLLHLLRR